MLQAMMAEENWPCIFQNSSGSSDHYDRWYLFYLSFFFTAVLYYFKDWGEGRNIIFYCNQFEHTQGKKFQTLWSVAARNAWQGAGSQKIL